jgi:hypothetical protein
MATPEHQTLESVIAKYRSQPDIMFSSVQLFASDSDNHSDNG